MSCTIMCQNEDELNLNEGEFVKVTELGTDEDVIVEWLFKDPGYGTFPKNYVSLMLEFEHKVLGINGYKRSIQHDTQDCLEF